MKEVTIVEAFTFTHNDGKQEKFTPGTYKMEDYLATHWYVVAHSSNPGPYIPAPGTPEFAREQARKIARRKLLDAAVEEANEQEK